MSEQSYEDFSTRITQVQSAYAELLMRKNHVIGVAMGLKKVAGTFTQQPCLVVLVDQKLPTDELDPEDQIPAEIDGIPIDVQEVGTMTAQ